MFGRKRNKTIDRLFDKKKSYLFYPLSSVFHSFSKHKISSFLLFLLASLLLFAPLLGAEKTYYVDKHNGYDDNSGLSPETPWRTIQKANQSLKPGDTVYIMAGTYHQTIKPENSGEAGQPITYARYQNDEVIISDVTMGVDLRNKHYVVIDGLTIRNTKYWVYMRFQPSTHNTIKNCQMEKCTSGWAGIYMGGDVNKEGNSHHNKILNNTLKGKCRPNNLIQCSSGATYNLIQGNEFFYGPHAAVELEGRSYPTHHNIIKDNVFHNYYHTALIVYTNAHHTLIEGNTILDSGEKHFQNDCGSEEDRTAARRYHRAIQLGGSYNIIRKNVLINNGSFCLESKDDESSLARHNRIYHNTLYKNHMALYSNCEGSVHQNILKNNIFYKNEDYEVHRYVTGSPKKDFFIQNDIRGAPIYHYPDGEVSLSFMQSQYPQKWKKNISQNPLFIDEKERDLHLKPSSPLIDAGAFLTQTTSQGNGKQIPVEDACYFMDGWGILEGDRVQLEGEVQSAKVTKVDYENNTLHVNRPLSWFSGQKVSLAHSGYAPDLGAFEYAESKPLEADINASPQTGWAPLEVQFSGNISGGHDSYSYKWKFGDGETSDKKNPEHTYSSERDYTVQLTASDSQGNEDTDSVIVHVSEKTPPLQASVQAQPTSGTAPLKVQFQTSVTGGIKPYRYHWDFGDGEFSQKKNPVHIYKEEGRYQAVCTVSGNEGREDKKSLNIQVIPSQDRINLPSKKRNKSGGQSQSFSSLSKESIEEWGSFFWKYLGLEEFENVSLIFFKNMISFADDENPKKLFLDFID